MSLTPTRADGVRSDGTQIYAEVRQAKAREEYAGRKTLSSPIKIESRHGMNPKVRVLKSKKLPPRPPPPYIPTIRRTESISPQPALMHPPEHSIRLCPPVSSPNTGTNRVARGKRRRLSNGSKRFTPEKKVRFNEDDNEEFSDDENVVKTVERSFPGSVLNSPSRTRSGRRFLPGPMR
jgi:hypothetical protein